jgi:sulfate adenylyltransferase
MNADGFASAEETANVALSPGLDTWESELHRLFANARKITNAQPCPFPTERQNSAVPTPATRGMAVFFTGFSGAGKTTIANMVLSKIVRIGRRRATLLDGDLVRRHLSSDLGFSRQDRDTNIRRIGYVASEITKRGGIAICAAIAPYDRPRKEARAMVQPSGAFVLIHVATPLDVCERRDPKGLYARARSGELQQFTGVSDPYEPPDDAELVLDTAQMDVEAAAQEVLLFLDRAGYAAGSDCFPPSPEFRFGEKANSAETDSPSWPLR